MTKPEIEKQVGRAITAEEFRQWHGVGTPAQTFRQQLLTENQKIIASSGKIKNSGHFNLSKKPWRNDLTFLACHNRIQDLLGHVDILEELRLPYVVLYSGGQELPIDFVEFKPSQGHNSPGIGVMTALQLCRDNGVETFRYVNADDWLFRRDLIDHWFGKLQTYDLCGYSWKGAGLQLDLTVNEVYVKTASFGHHDTKACIRELEKAKHGYVEDHLGRIMMPGIKLYRLPGREVPRGIGFRDDKHDRRNSRWWNREWQGIYSHDEKQRFDFYLQLRPWIKIAPELEKREFFGAWFDYHASVEKEGSEKYVN